MDIKTYKALQSKYDNTLKSINAGRWYRLSMDEFKDIMSITGTNAKPSEVSCNSCRQRILRGIAREYTSYQPRTGRPKKIDLDAE